MNTGENCIKSIVLRREERQRQLLSLLTFVSSDMEPSSSADRRESADNLDLAVVTVSLFTSVSKKLSDDTVNMSEFSAFSLELAETANCTALSSQNGVRILRRSCRDNRPFSSSVSSSVMKSVIFNRPSHQVKLIALHLPGMLLFVLRLLPRGALRNGIGLIFVDSTASSKLLGVFST